MRARLASPRNIHETYVQCNGLCCFNLVIETLFDCLYNKDMLIDLNFLSRNMVCWSQFVNIFVAATKSHCLCLDTLNIYLILSLL